MRDLPNSDRSRSMVSAHPPMVVPEDEWSLVVAAENPASPWTAVQAALADTESYWRSWATLLIEIGVRLLRARPDRLQANDVGRSRATEPDEMFVARQVRQLIVGRSRDLEGFDERWQTLVGDARGYLSEDWAEELELLGTLTRRERTAILAVVDSALAAAGCPTLRRLAE